MIQWKWYIRRRKTDPKPKSTSRPHVVSDLTGCQRRFHLILPSSLRAAAAWFHQSVARVTRTWSFFTSSELTSCVQSSDWSNYPSLSFTDSAFFQSYVSCFAFLWPSELFSSGPSCCRSGDELSCTIRKILTKWHRLFTAPHHIIITCVTAPLFAWPLLDVLSDSHLYGT